MKVIEKLIEINSVFEGTADQVAFKVIEQIIEPAYAAMHDSNPNQAKKFMFFLAGGVIGSFLEKESDDQIDATAEMLCAMIKDMASKLKGVDSPVVS